MPVVWKHFVPQGGWNISVTHGHGMLVAMDAASSKRLLHGQEVKLAEVVVGFGAWEINFSDCRCLGTVCAEHNCICQRCQRALTKLGYIIYQPVCFGFMGGSPQRIGGEGVKADTGDNTTDIHSKTLLKVFFSPIGWPGLDYFCQANWVLRFVLRTILDLLQSNEWSWMVQAIGSTRRV